MQSRIVVIAGPAGSGKTERLVADYRRALREGGHGAGLWIAPTRRAASDIRGRLLGPDLKACFSPNCVTFEQLGRAVLESSGLRIRPLTPLAKWTLLRGLIDDALQAGQLEYFAPIAETSGWIDQVDQFIRELKRLEIWPEEFLQACRERGATAKDRELARLYTQYQTLLNNYDLYDSEGRFWQARAQLQQGNFGPFGKVNFVVVDGFTDFNRTQHEVLEVFAQRAAGMAITLPLEAEPVRRDLFGKSSRTLAELQKRHPQLQIELATRAEAAPRKGKKQAATGGTWPAMAHLERELFRNLRQARPAVDMAGIEILAAAGQLGEIEMVARRVKRLLVEGDDLADRAAVRPSDVLVVFRSLGDLAELVREVFGDMGVPVAIEQAPVLASAPLVGALLHLLKLQQQDWPFRELLAWLSHNYFQPNWPEWKDGEASLAAEHLVRQLQMPSGRNALLRQLERWASQRPPEESSAELPDGRVNRRMQKWQYSSAAFPLLARLERALGQLPEKASPTAWVAALEQMAGDIGLHAAADRDPSTKERDAVAWTTLIRALYSQEQLAEWLGQSPPEWDLAELVEHLTDASISYPLPHGQSEVGCVQVLSAISARCISAPYVFFAGLSEKAFPQPASEARIYGDSDVMQLASAGLPLPSRVEQSQDEMLLFYEVVTRARRRLWLSYPALDQKAQPLSPSPYLTEVERACGEGQITRHSELLLSPVPQDSMGTCSLRDVRIKAVADSLAGDAALLGSLCQRRDEMPQTENLLAALRLADSRRGQTFSEFEGLIASESVAKVLVQRFGPERCWSPSQLEQYALCPYQFYAQRVLRLEPLEDLALEVDYLTRGRMLHGALATLHRRLNERHGPSSPCGQDEAEYLTEVGGILEELVKVLGPDTALDSALREIDRRLLTDWLAKYRQQHEIYEAHWSEHDQPFLPRYFEVSFGPSNAHHDPDQADLEFGATDSLSSNEPFRLQCGEEQVQLSGRIDRVDVGVVAGQAAFNIVDYKSGSAARLSNKAIFEARALQLPLYALAVESLLADQNAIPWRAAYWYLKDKGYKGAIEFFQQSGVGVHVDAEWDALRTRLVEKVLSIVQGIRSGQFPVFSTDDDCTGYCQFSKICRVHQVRSLEKPWPPVMENPS